MIRAAIYCRVSTPGQEERGYGLDGQLADCRALAIELGMSIVAERWEVGSGADPNLPVILELMEAGRRGDFDVLLVYDTSRLARDVGKLLAIEQALTRAGVQVQYVRQKFDDSPAGDLQKTIMAAVDSFERGNLVLRFTLGKRAKIGRGLVMGQGQVPHGYRRIVNGKTGKTEQLEIDPGQAAIVRRIISDLREHSIDQVADRLNAEEIPSPTRRRWSGASVYAIFKNPAIQGQYVHGKTTEVRNPRDDKRRIVRRPVKEWAPVAISSDRELRRYSRSPGGDETAGSDPWTSSCQPRIGPLRATWNSEVWFAAGSCRPPVSRSRSV
jgi:site-specific DNA recombinase